MADVEDSADALLSGEEERLTTPAPLTRDSFVTSPLHFTHFDYRHVKMWPHSSKELSADDKCYIEAALVSSDLRGIQKMCVSCEDFLSCADLLF
jgi:hypothetical protein